MMCPWHAWILAYVEQIDRIERRFVPTVRVVWTEMTTSMLVAKEKPITFASHLTVVRLSAAFNDNGIRPPSIVFRQ